MSICYMGDFPLTNTYSTHTHGILGGYICVISATNSSLARTNYLISDLVSVWEARQKATFLHSPLRTESRVYFILNLRTVVVVVAAVELENLKFYRLSGFIPQTWHGMVCLDFFLFIWFHFIHRPTTHHSPLESSGCLSPQPCLGV